MIESKKLSMEDLDNVSGGLIFNAAPWGIYGTDPDNPWQVIDNFDGKVLGSFPTKEAAMTNARSYGGDPYNVLEVPDYDSLLYLRRNPKDPN